MQIKIEIRKNAREKRKALTNKEQCDLLIAKTLLNSNAYKNAKTVLIYVSLDDEIKTDSIINNALESGKTVAVPFCWDKQGNMDFYIINSLDVLKSGSFGVREPDINKSKKLTGFNNSVIIVPGLVFDKNGYRVGFGKGYYDRFLSKNEIYSIGLCYDELLISEVPRDEYDKNVDLIITQSSVINCEDGGKNG